MGIAELRERIGLPALTPTPSIEAYREAAVSVAPIAAPIAATPVFAAVAINGGGGGITVKPWWDIFPKTPAEAVTRTVETPVISPVGGAAVVFKSITKQTGMRLLPLAGGAIGGFLFGRLFGGGAAPQEQQQDITQTPEVTVTPEMPVDVTVDPTITTLTDLITKFQLRSGADIEIGAGAKVVGDIGTTETITHTTTNSLIYNIQKTITETYPTQITKTITTTTAAQEATQEQGTDWITIVLIAVAGLIGWQFLKKRA